MESNETKVHERLESLSGLNTGVNLGIANYDLKCVLCMDDTYSVRDNISTVTGGIFVLYLRRKGQLINRHEES